MTALYLSYQSLLEPLTQTQGVAYLEGLARAGYQVVLLTFEPRWLGRDEVCAWRPRLGDKGIVWRWCRYHKRPSVPTTAWDVMTGTLAGLWPIRRFGVRLVHARAHVAGVMELLLKWTMGTKLLFDVHGLMAEENVDARVK